MLIDYANARILKINYLDYFQEDLGSECQEVASDIEEQDETQHSKRNKSPAVSESMFSHLSSPSEPRNRHRKKRKMENPRIEEAFGIIKNYKATRSPYSAYGQHIAQKLSGYSNRTRALVEHSINNILFDADMGLFDRSTATVTRMNQLQPDRYSITTPISSPPFSHDHSSASATSYREITSPDIPNPNSTPENSTNINLAQFVQQYTEETTFTELRS